MAPPPQTHHGGVSTTILPISEDISPDLLEGTMDLNIILPSKKSIRMTVNRRTPMMDLLIQVCDSSTTANKINPSGHIVQVRNERGIELPYKPSTPIGALDTTLIEIVPKNQVNEYIIVKKHQKIANQPFESTFRLQVHLPRNQLHVMRVGSKTILEDILNEVCQEKNLDKAKYELRHPVNLDERLCTSSRLGDYGLQELRLVSKNTKIQSSVTASDIIRSQNEKGFLNSPFKHSKSSVGDSSESASSARSDDSRSISPLPPIRPKLKLVHTVSNSSLNSSTTPSTPPSTLVKQQNTSMQAPTPVSRTKKRAPAPPTPQNINSSSTISTAIISDGKVKPSVVNLNITKMIDESKKGMGKPASIHSRHSSSDSSGYHESSLVSEEHHHQQNSHHNTFERQISSPAALGHTSPNILNNSKTNLTSVPSISTTSLASSQGGRSKRLAPKPPLKSIPLLKEVQPEDFPDSPENPCCISEKPSAEQVHQQDTCTDSETGSSAGNISSTSSISTKSFDKIVISRTGSSDSRSGRDSKSSNGSGSLEVEVDVHNIPPSLQRADSVNEKLDHNLESSENLSEACSSLSNTSFISPNLSENSSPLPSPPLHLTADEENMDKVNGNAQESEFGKEPSIPPRTKPREKNNNQPPPAKSNGHRKGSISSSNSSEDQKIEVPKPKPRPRTDRPVSTELILETGLSTSTSKIETPPSTLERKNKKPAPTRPKSEFIQSLSSNSGIGVKVFPDGALRDRETFLKSTNPTDRSRKNPLSANYDPAAPSIIHVVRKKSPEVEKPPPIVESSGSGSDSSGSEGDSSDNLEENLELFDKKRKKPAPKAPNRASEDKKSIEIEPPKPLKPRSNKPIGDQSLSTTTSTTTSTRIEEKPSSNNKITSKESIRMKTKAAPPPPKLEEKVEVVKTSQEIITANALAKEKWLLDNNNRTSSSSNNTTTTTDSGDKNKKGQLSKWDGLQALNGGNADEGLKNNKNIVNDNGSTNSTTDKMKTSSQKPNSNDSKSTNAEIHKKKISLSSISSSSSGEVGESQRPEDNSEIETAAGSKFKSADHIDPSTVDKMTVQDKKVIPAEIHHDSDSSSSEDNEIKPQVKATSPPKKLSKSESFTHNSEFDVVKMRRKIPARKSSRDSDSYSDHGSSSDDDQKHHQNVKKNKSRTSSSMQNLSKSQKQGNRMSAGGNIENISNSSSSSRARKTNSVLNINNVAPDIAENPHLMKAFQTELEEQFEQWKEQFMQKHLQQQQEQQQAEVVEKKEIKSSPKVPTPTGESIKMQEIENKAQEKVPEIKPEVKEAVSEGDLEAELEVEVEVKKIVEQKEEIKNSSSDSSTDSSAGDNYDEKPQIVHQVPNTKKIDDPEMSSSDSDEQRTVEVVPHVVPHGDDNDGKIEQEHEEIEPKRVEEIEQNEAKIVSSPSDDVSFEQFVVKRRQPAPKEIPSENGKKQQDDHEPVYKYSGPPQIQMGTWTDKPRRQVSVKKDKDYIMGMGQHDPKSIESSSKQSIMRINSFNSGNSGGVKSATLPHKTKLANFTGYNGSTMEGNEELDNKSAKSVVSMWKQKLAENNDQRKATTPSPSASPVPNKPTILQNQLSLNEKEIKIESISNKPTNDIKYSTLPSKGSSGKMSNSFQKPIVNISPMVKGMYLEKDPSKIMISSQSPLQQYHQQKSEEKQQKQQQQDVSSTTGGFKNVVVKQYNYEQNQQGTTAAGGKKFPPPVKDLEIINIGDSSTNLMPNSSRLVKSSSTSLADRKSFFQGIQPVDDSKEKPIPAVDMKNSISKIQSVFEQRRLQQQQSSEGTPALEKVVNIVYSQHKANNSNALMHKVIQNNKNINIEELRRTPTPDHAAGDQKDRSSWNTSSTKISSNGDIETKVGANNNIKNVGNKAIITVGSSPAAASGENGEGTTSTNGNFYKQQLKVTGISTTESNSKSNAKDIEKEPLKINIVNQNQQQQQQQYGKLQQKQPEPPKSLLISELNKKVGHKSNEPEMIIISTSSSASNEYKSNIANNNSGNQTTSISIGSTTTNGGSNSNWTPPPPPPPLNLTVKPLDESPTGNGSLKKGFKRSDSKNSPTSPTSSSDPRAELLNAIKNANGKFGLKKTGSILN